MKQLKYFFVFILFVFFTNILFAQQSSVFSPGNYRDAIYEKENAIGRRPTPYTFLREADVTWQKRVWRRLDMREKMNQSLYYPVKPVKGRLSLPQLVLQYLLDKDPNNPNIAFKGDDEEFMHPFSKQQILELLVKFDDANKDGIPDSTDITRSYDSTFIDPKTGKQDPEAIGRGYTLGDSYTHRVIGDKDSTWFFEEFSSLKIKEDWFFDKQKGSLEVRILGLGFVAPSKKDGITPETYFWIYFPAWRPIFAANEVFNTKNDSERRTFEDVFSKRQFASTILKESNVYDRTIQDYTKGIDALLESDRVKSDIFRFEHDLWQF